MAQQAEVERLEKEKAEKERQEMIAKGLIIPDEYEQQSNEGHASIIPTLCFLDDNNNNKLLMPCV